MQMLLQSACEHAQHLMLMFPLAYDMQLGWESANASRACPSRNSRGEGQNGVCT